jgi:hypothetical protein
VCFAHHPFSISLAAFLQLMNLNPTIGIVDRDSNLRSPSQLNTKEAKHRFVWEVKAADKKLFW